MDKKKNLFGLTAILMVALISLCLTSCGSDDDDDVPETSSLIGTWKCVNSYDEWDGGHIDDYMVGEFLVVNADNTFTSTSSSIGSGTYTISGNKMTAKVGTSKTFTATISLKGNTLVLNGNTNDGIKFKYTFEKVTSK